MHPNNSVEYENNHSKPTQRTGWTYLPCAYWMMSILNMDKIVECAGELKCDNLVIVTYNDKRTIEKDGYTINVVPVTEF